ncbi:MAG: pirin family protein [Acidobacteria bacterium]|nr:pirin family protein [Acidobacteriota bacterium]
MLILGHHPRLCRLSPGVGFSDLLLLNDDRVKPGGGFATHEHKDTEVFSYVLEGALEHEDSMGEGSVVRPREVLMMSAGTGITHSEFNHSKTDVLRFLQIWMAADRKGVLPRYNQKTFSDAGKRGRLCPLLAPEGKAADGAMPWYTDCTVYAGLFDGAERAELTLGPDRYAYVHVIRGALEVNGTQFNEGDGARVRHEERLVFSNGRDAEILVFDLRPRELPATVSETAATA